MASFENPEKEIEKSEEEKEIEKFRANYKEVMEKLEEGGYWSTGLKERVKEEGELIVIKMEKAAGKHEIDFVDEQDVDSHG